MWIVTLGNEVIGIIRRTPEGLRTRVVHRHMETREIHEQVEQESVKPNRWQRRRRR